MNCFLYGGSFDPPHMGHRSVLDSLLRLGPQRAIHHIILMPAGRSPFKDYAPAPAEHRVAMLEIMVRDALSDLEIEPKAAPVSVEVHNFELRSDGPSYTARTLRHLRKGGLDPILVLGADSLMSVDRWKEADYILGSTPLLIFFRRGESRDTVLSRIEDLRKSALAIELIEDIPPDCSSTSLRRWLRESLHDKSHDKSEEMEPSQNPCMAEDVLQYIRQTNLYKS